MSKYNRVPQTEHSPSNAVSAIKPTKTVLGIQLSARNLMLLALVSVVVFVYFLMPSSSKHVYSVVIDAGSTGSRVHVYEFEQTPNGVQVVDEMFEQLKPGLSSYDSDVDGAVKSLQPLMKKALDRVPVSLQQETQVALGATAGLRMLGDVKSEAILKGIRAMLRESPFILAKDSDCRILGGNDEGKFAWVAVNLLLGQIGGPPSTTSPVCDLGGGSVQCMFAREQSQLRAEADSKLEAYLEDVAFQSTKYQLYVHSYLGYGMMAGRMAVLSDSANNPGLCMAKGFRGEYEYNGHTVVSNAGPSGPNFDACTAAVTKILKLSDPCEVPGECSFAGTWGGGLAKSLRNRARMHFLSYIYDRFKLIKAGHFTPGNVDGTANILSFLKKARNVCSLSTSELKSEFESSQMGYFSTETHIDEQDQPYLCLDLAYIAGLVQSGVGMPPEQQFAMDKKIESGGKLFEAAWTLGMALEIM